MNWTPLRFTTELRLGPALMREFLPWTPLPRIQSLGGGPTTVVLLVISPFMGWGMGFIYTYMGWGMGLFPAASVVLSGIRPYIGGEP